MDSEHRHELKESDLANFLASAKEWWGKHQTKVLLLAIVVAGGILALRWMRQSAYAAHENAWSELNSEVSPTTLAQIATSSTDPAIRALAALRAGDDLLAKAIRPSSGEDDTTTDADREKDLAQAEKLFKSVVDTAPAKAYVINAQFRLATIAEQRRNWDVAKQYYAAIQKEAGEGFESFAARAKGMEASLAEVKTEPVFAPEPKKLPETTTPGVTPDPTKGDPTKQDPTKQDPTKEDPTKADPTKTDPTKTDPAKSDPAKVDPAKTDPAKTDPAKTDPATTDPAKDAAEKKAPTP